ncbi:hypothetical protein PBI_MRMAGOO_168 [Mycobacterium phage MrMagoo]|uniref:Uncharacterized protein n=1 Tax=Mycobacterium phage MrMagoo TaxID=1927020 RepID=A0A1L6BYU9_9CAUD|nr:hypothetical protein J4U04_gp112 [Mycobacterium phage MrMagoo]APQ42261.1 hypothetical protein PBI_MRMAGOO_168 [Mycobacterium phage MrMagoo]
MLRTPAGQQISRPVALSHPQFLQLTSTAQLLTHGTTVGTLELTATTETALTMYPQHWTVIRNDHMNSLLRVYFSAAYRQQRAPRPVDLGALLRV